MKIALIGSRGLNLKLEDILSHLPEDKRKNISGIVSGGARGIDSLAPKLAEYLNVECIEFLPDYNSFGRSAPLIRNKEIINHSGAVLAFWDSKSRGTMHAIKYAKSKNKKVKLIEI